MQRNHRQMQQQFAHNCSTLKVQLMIRNNLPEPDCNSHFSVKRVHKDSDVCVEAREVCDIIMKPNLIKYCKLNYAICLPICQSLKIGNCFNLARSFSHAAVLGDHVCKVQCAFVFRALPRIVDPVDNQLGFS
ncbi:hypothetical protein C0J52_23564 [Blattella germanica]|nr:hypothetical protein C0J52_23564 [Blattella germanica]